MGGLAKTKLIGQPKITGQRSGWWSDELRALSRAQRALEKSSKEDYPTELAAVNAAEEALIKSLSQ